MSVVKRPQTDFDATSHSYSIEGEKLPGISTIAKVGGFEETFGIASAWGFRVGYEGAWEAVYGETGRGIDWECDPPTKDELRTELKKRGLTPWSQRDKAAARGNWVHDVLEALGQSGDIPDLSGFPDEVAGHARAVLRWFIDYRPEFVSTEVQVTSLEHRFSGRYDIRAKVRFEESCGGCEFCDGEGWCPEEWLCLIDLKTSKDVYPLTHFPQLAGYELASVEMGFPATDAQFVLNTKPDGTYQFVRSWATAEHFLAYLGALNAVRDIEAKDPEVRRMAEREEAILGQLPRRFNEIEVDLEPGPKKGLLMGMKRAGRVVCEKGLWSSAITAS